MTWLGSFWRMDRAAAGGGNPHFKLNSLSRADSAGNLDIPMARASVLSRALSTYAKQHAVPRLPVPGLDQTLTKYLRTVEPLCDAATLRATERAVAESRPQLHTLQERLVHGAAAQRNWLERDWDNGGP